MTTINDLFQLKLFASNITTPVEQVNVFWYRLLTFGSVTIGDPVSRELALRFNTYIVSVLNDIVSDDQQYLRTEIVNYGDVTDFDICVGDCNYPSFGAIGGEQLPAQVCWTFRYTRPFPGARSGFKRFSGISELSQADNIPTGAAIVFLDLLADRLGEVLVTPLGVQFIPVIARTPKVLGQNPLYYEVPGVVYAGIGSQNSRKSPLSV